jgi:8-oxo-dGTP pyrophosphatase MutT (NUDIX family)
MGEGRKAGHGRVTGSSRRPKKTAGETGISPKARQAAKSQAGKDGGPKDEGTRGRSTKPVVRAGGGAVWRRVPTGAEVVLVHRPAYDDWAFPKGKLEPGETDEQAAVREVREETGLSCRLGTELPSTTYVDGQGRPKLVRYWSMTVIRRAPPRGAASNASMAASLPDAPLAPEPKARREVDKVYWAPIEEARSLLTYPRDVVVLDSLSDLLSGSNVRRQ